ncbi:DUF6624 domain-containing protein [Novosphingobium sp. JCM 18896]|uniref:DUF6624 domain-containing protein n=1 Tax=Novosphingobium sp. JCM 18896 TaxID=2989731 RepID=UPI002223BA2B|nr:DUF6624 domain-containing protein [Novosphingobium sp. JCM 18896]MCW1427631.1 hypothetical protein [Novosphingobium sp. JCM 18896]
MIVLQFLAAVVAALPPLTVEARARLEPFDAVVAQVRAAHDAAGPASDDRERLARLWDLDQKPIRAAQVVNVEGLDAEQARAVKREVQARLETINRENLEQLYALLPAAGWFTRTDYGDHGAEAAFLVVQHSTAEVQRRFLPSLERFAASGDVAPSQYALMYDRLALADGKLQRYGTQMRCEAGRMVPAPTEDPDRLEERRAPMGFRWPTYADYLKNFGAC